MRKKTHSILIKIKNLSFSYLSVFCVLISGLSFFACKNSSSKQEKYEPAFSSDSSGKKVLIFGVPSLQFFETTDPLIKYLNKNLNGVQIRTVACITFDDYLDKLKKKYFDFTILNGVQALDEEKNGYSIVGKMGDDDKYRGVIFVRKDSAIENFSDLQGKTMSLAGPTALAGTMMPLFYLYKNGVDVNKDIKRLYVASFESSIMNVYMGNCAAGAAWLVSWEHFIKERPEVATRVFVKWKTPSLPNTAVIIRNNVDKETANELTRLLLTLHNNEEGKKALEVLTISKFEKADSNTYKVLRDFMKEYNSVIH